MPSATCSDVQNQGIWRAEVHKDKSQTQWKLKSTGFLFEV